MSKTNHVIKDITLVSICAAILFVQQLALSFLPNIQFSTLLIVIYAKTFGFKRTTMIIVVHVIVVNLLSPFGPMIPVYIPSMFIAWMLIPILLSTVFKKMESPYKLAIFGFFFGFVYGWLFIPVSVFVLDIPFVAYLLMDLPFELMMAISNFLTILWLYEPLKKVLVMHRIRYDTIA